MRHPVVDMKVTFSDNGHIPKITIFIIIAFKSGIKISDDCYLAVW